MTKKEEEDTTKSPIHESKQSETTSTDGYAPAQSTRRTRASRFDPYPGNPPPMVAKPKINKYPCWPLPDDSHLKYTTWHPLGWPIDPEFRYQIHNYLMGGGGVVPVSSMTGAPMAMAGPGGVGIGIGGVGVGVGVGGMGGPTAAVGATPGVSGMAAIPAQIAQKITITSQGASIGIEPIGKQHSLFVFHIPEEVDDAALLNLFIPYGSYRANVMRHETGRSRGFGFVHFPSREEAQGAIDGMNGHQIGRKRLRVSFKKEDNPGQPQQG